jgi:hypothetical protein
MKLDLGADRTLDGPDADTIARSLAELDWEKDVFAKLSRDKLNYIQACGSHREGFIVEYQDGSKARFFQAANRLNIEALQSAFVAYARRDSSWQTSAQWQKVDLMAAAGGRLRMWLLITVAFACIAFVLFMFIMRLLAAIHQMSH